MFFDLSIGSLLDILSISTAFMLGLLFFTTKSKNRKANVFLGLFLWSLCMEVISSFLSSQGFDEELTVLTPLFTILFLFLYVHQTLNKKFQLFFVVLFLPGILINFVFVPHYFEYVFNISLLLYILVTLKDHKKDARNFYSDLENRTLSWIRAIVFAFLFFHLLWIIEDLVGIQNEEMTEYFAEASNVLTFLMIYWIGYNGFSQSEIFTSRQFLISKKDVRDQSISNIELSKKFNVISNTILAEKIYTDTHLNLKTLSVQLQLKEKELSRIINQHTGKNFYHFINEFRVAEFKKLLASPRSKQLSILGLAQEAGFSSKSTFYTVFKNVEGITPKQYLQQLKTSE